MPIDERDRASKHTAPTRQAFNTW
ncbi:hypothetical protein BC2230_50393 [Burkholderia cepacia]